MSTILGSENVSEDNGLDPEIKDSIASDKIKTNSSSRKISDETIKKSIRKFIQIENAV